MSESKKTTEDFDKRMNALNTGTGDLVDRWLKLIRENSPLVPHLEINLKNPDQIYADVQETLSYLPTMDDFDASEKEVEESYATIKLIKSDITDTIFKHIDTEVFLKYESNRDNPIKNPEYAFEIYSSLMYTDDIAKRKKESIFSQERREEFENLLSSLGVSYSLVDSPFVCYSIPLDNTSRIRVQLGSRPLEELQVYKEDTLKKKAENQPYDAMFLAVHSALEVQSPVTGIAITLETNNEQEGAYLAIPAKNEFIGMLSTYTETYRKVLQALYAERKVTPDFTTLTFSTE